jgi:hypothetical protein
MNCSILALDGLLLRSLCPLALERALDLESLEELRFLDLLLDRFLDLLLDLDRLFLALPRLLADDSGDGVSTETTDFEDVPLRSKETTDFEDVLLRSINLPSGMTVLATE